MFKQASGFHGKNIIVEGVCCENPDGKVKKQMHFESELPEDMKALIEKWRKYSMNRNL